MGKYWQQLTMLQKVTVWAWLAYLPYHVYMRWWETTVIAPIRIDLLLIYPMLAILTVLAIGQWIWQTLKTKTD